MCHSNIQTKQVCIGLWVSGGIHRPSGGIHRPCGRHSHIVMYETLYDTKTTYNCAKHAENVRVLRAYALKYAHLSSLTVLGWRLNQDETCKCY